MTVPPRATPVVAPGPTPVTIAAGLTKAFPRCTERFLVTAWAGIIAGESLVGAGDALRLVFAGAAK